MEQKRWSTWWFVFSVNYSRLFWVHHQNAQEVYWSSSNKKTSKIENSIAFKVKAEYFLELFTTETMKLLQSGEKKIT